jgi:hypothetical protein
MQKAPLRGQTLQGWQRSNIRAWKRRAGAKNGAWGKELWATHPQDYSQRPGGQYIQVKDGEQGERTDEIIDTQKEGNVGMTRRQAGR